MFIDASVIVAILNEEAGYEELEKQLEAGGKFHISPLVRFEAVAALVRLRLEATDWKADRSQAIGDARQLVDDFIQALNAKEVVIDNRIGNRALDAMSNFGKASGHAAALNIGDCFAYAASDSYRLKLLYKGNDFAHTDIAASSRS